jgi:hypothetical protein
MMTLMVMMLCAGFAAAAAAAAGDTEETAAAAAGRALVLSKLASSHPVDFCRFIDSWARATQQPAAAAEQQQQPGSSSSSTCRMGASDIIECFELLELGICRLRGRELLQLLGAPAAVAALGSALSSVMKMASQWVRQAKEDECFDEASLQESDNEAKRQQLRLVLRRLMLQQCFDPANGVLVQLLQQLSEGVRQAAAAAVAQPAQPNTSSSSSGIGANEGQQVAASSVFLLLLAARGVVSMHGALCQCTGRCVNARGVVSMHDTLLTHAEVAAAAAQAAAGADDAAATDVQAAPGDAAILMLDGATADRLHQCMAAACRCFMDIRAAMMLAALPQQQQSAPASSADSAIPHQPAGSTLRSANPGSSNSSSSSRGVCWGYLLRLQQSRKLMAAAAMLDGSLVRHGQQAQEDLLQVALGSTAQDGVALDECSEESGRCCTAQHERQQMRELHQNILTFCRTQTALAPLPVVCNNARCTVLSEGTEAAAARYVCAGCGCRYCSAACQAAGWRSHKKACRRMAACGMRVQQR